MVLGSRLAKKFKFKFEASFEVAANDIVLASYYHQFTGVVWSIPSYPLPSFGWKYSFDGLFCLCTTQDQFWTELQNCNDFASLDEREGVVGTDVNA